MPRDLLDKTKLEIEAALAELINSGEEMIRPFNPTMVRRMDNNGPRVLLSADRHKHLRVHRNRMEAEVFAGQEPSDCAVTADDQVSIPAEEFNARLSCGCLLRQVPMGIVQVVASYPIKSGRPRVGMDDVTAVWQHDDLDSHRADQAESQPVDPKLVGPEEKTIKIRNPDVAVPQQVGQRLPVAVIPAVSALPKHDVKVGVAD